MSKPTTPSRSELEAQARARLEVLRELGADELLLTGWAGLEGERSYSERVNIKEADIQPLAREEYREHIAWLESETGGIVFQVTVEHSIMGDLLDLYLASPDTSTWAGELDGLRQGRARAWVAALDMPPSSNWFDVEFEIIDGALVRVG